MNAPKVELKNVNTFRGMDGYGLNADLWINGVKCMSVIDGGDGGCMDYQSYAFNNPKADVVKANIKLLEDYIKTLPDIESDLGDEKFTYKADMDWFVNDLLAKQEIEKERKKMEKQFANSIVFGVPNADRYSYIKYKVPLNKVPIFNLQKDVDTIKGKYCKDGVQILNNNLQQLGVIC